MFFLRQFLFRISLLGSIGMKVSVNLIKQLYVYQKLEKNTYLRDVDGSESLYLFCNNSSLSVKFYEEVTYYIGFTALAI